MGQVLARDLIDVLNNIQAWWNKSRQAKAEFEDRHVLLEWARQQGALCRRVKHPQTGWVLEWPDGNARLEWGPSRRPYIFGHELRWIFPCEMNLSAEMVVLSQSFATRIEAELFGKLTAENHTTLESGLPDEVRWIAMWPAYLLPETRDGSRLVCHSQNNTWRDVWSDPALISALQRAGRSWWQTDSAVTLSCNRKTLVLRLAAGRLEKTNLDQMKWFLDQMRQTILECKF